MSQPEREEDAMRDVDVIPRRRWTLVAERIGGQRTARWFRDESCGAWYVAESWKRPNRGRPLTSEQAAYVEGLIGGAR